MPRLTWSRPTACRSLSPLLAALALAMPSTLPLQGAEASGSSEPPLALVGGTLVDVSDYGRSSRDLKDSVVVIRDGKVVAAGPRTDVAVPEGARRIDVGGKYLVPGLVDSFSALGKQRHADAYLYFGVTSIVGVDGQPRRPDLFRGSDPGPRLYPLGIVGYGPQGDDMVQLSEAETMAQLEEEAKKGTKVILIHYPITAERTGQIVKRAHELGLGTIGELGMTKIADAIGAGVDAFVHTSRYSLGIAPEETRLAVAKDPFGPPRDAFYRSLVALDPADAKLAAHAKLLASGPIALIPTLAMNYLDLPGHRNPWLVPGARIVDPRDIHLPADPATGQRESAAPEPGISAFPEHFGEALLRIEERYVKAGARYLTGSGTTAFGTIPGVSLHTEIELLRGLGLPPRQLLAAATSNFGAIFGWTGIGEIKAGYDADLLVLDGDPLADLATLQAPRMVILRGRILDRDKLLAGTK